MKLNWHSSDIFKLFRLKEKNVSKQTLFNVEEKGLIPRARRMKRGSLMVRSWEYSQLPDIGKYFGFLKTGNKQQVICCYTAKGGVLKTTISYNVAKALALNGIKTLLVGLDIQCSLTDITIPIKKYESLEEASSEDRLGLFHLIYENAEVRDVITKTELPSLDIIAETHELSILEKKLRYENRREYLFLDKIIPKLSDYEVVIFDNSPSWNQLIENSLIASNIVISPIGCDLLSYKAIETNISNLFEYFEIMNKKWDKLFLIPTLLERNKLSQQIYGAYLNKYDQYLVSCPIRRAIQGQEATLLNLSAIENDPESLLAQDYYDLIQELWKKINS